jgi:molybdopterin synthase sulfur carrier subunit
MKIKVKFFATFRELFGAELRELELGSGTDIKELLNILCDSRQCHAAVIDSSGNLRPYIKVFDNGRDIKFLDGMHTELKEGDVVALFPPVGGG